MKGKVKFYNNIKEFGFISGDDGKDVFVHKSDLINTDSLDEGCSVSFDVENGPKGLRALNVKKE